MTADALLTVKEYAALMRVGEETVRRWLRAGRLKARRTCEPHGHWRIYTSDDTLVISHDHDV